MPPVYPFDREGAREKLHECVMTRFAAVRVDPFTVRIRLHVTRAAARVSERLQRL